MGEVPTPIEAVAAKRGAQVVRERLDRDVSGLLFRDDESVMIGVNDLHAPRRQRFTIAHEVGHLEMHKGRPLVLDHVRINMRDATSSTATDVEEIEANQFAAAILMPSDLVIREAKRLLKDDPSATDASIVPAPRARLRGERAGDGDPPCQPRPSSPDLTRRRGRRG